MSVPKWKVKKQANLPDNLLASWLVEGSQSNYHLDHFLRKEDILQTPEKKNREEFWVTLWFLNSKHES